MSSLSWTLEKGGEEKFATISDLPPSIIAVASGCESETVSGSSFSNSLSPHSFAAAICSAVAWPETFTAGTAMRCWGVKSFSDLIAGSRTVSVQAIALRPLAARTSTLLRVRDQIVMIPVGPSAAKSRLPEINASFMTSLERNVDQSTVTSPRPASLACFSTSFWSSISMSWM